MRVFYFRERYVCGDNIPRIIGSQSNRLQRQTVYSASRNADGSIQSAMKRLLKGRTSFVVAHRLSTIYDADRILVMDHGDIVETGNHKELLKLNGVYADIYNSQFAQIIA